MNHILKYTYTRMIHMMYNMCVKLGMDRQVDSWIDKQIEIDRDCTIERALHAWKKEQHNVEPAVVEYMGMYPESLMKKTSVTRTDVLDLPKATANSSCMNKQDTPSNSTCKELSLQWGNYIVNRRS